MQRTHQAVSATEIKNRFGDYLADVTGSHRVVCVKKHGKPVAVLVSFEEWQRLKEGVGLVQKTPWADACKELAVRIAKNHPNLKKFSAAELVRRIREEEE